MQKEKKKNFQIIFFSLFFLTVFLIFNKAQASTLPVLNFSDITSGPKTGNTDGVGSGAIVTIWGNYLGTTQGNSKIYVGNAEVSAVYYWKNADGKLPSGPSDLYTYHKMQEIAFAIPANALDGDNIIKVVVNGIETNTLPFTVRTGGIKFIKATGNDTTGDGSWESPWATLQNVMGGGNGKVMEGDTVYSVGVGSTAGLSVGYANGSSVPIKGTQNNPVSLIVYPNFAALLSGHAAGNNGGWVINNWWATNSTLSSEYINFSKFKILAAGNGDDSSSGFHTFKGNRVVGIEITGPTVYGGYAGAISGSGGFGGVGAGENAGGGKYYGIYIHNYGYQSKIPGLNNYGWDFENNSNTWDSPPYDGVGDLCTNCNSVDRFQHLYYISDRSPDSIQGYEIGWNNLIDNDILQGIHIYDQGPNIGGWNSPIIVHDNVVKNQRAASINVSYPVADVGPNAGTAAPIYIYNNIIINDVDYKGNGWALSIQGGSSAKIYNNTIYGYRYINIVRPAVSDYRNNIMHEVNVPLDYNYYIYDRPTTKSNNLFYGTHLSAMPNWFSTDLGDLNVNPLFTNTAKYDFSLQTTSPAINAGSDIVLTIASRDFFGQPRISGKVSLGAIDYVSSTSESIIFSISNFQTLLLKWLKIDTVSDLNFDNFVNTRDLGIMMSKWE